MAVTKINGDEVTVHSGDQIVTLEERLTAMQKSIHRLWIVIGAWIVLQILWAIVGPEAFAQIVRNFLDIAV